MITKHILQVFGEFAFRFISKKVNVLTTRCGYSKSDRADLYQDFATNLIARSAKYDPNAANWEGFVVVVCENHFADILARRFAEKRNCQREKFSLNASVIDRGGKRRGRSGKVEEHHHYKRTGNDSDRNGKRGLYPTTFSQWSQDSRTSSVPYAQS